MEQETPLQSPDRDYYRDAPWFSYVITLLVSHVIFLSVIMLVLLATGSNMFSTTFSLILWVPLIPPFALSLFIIVAMSLEDSSVENPTAISTVHSLLLIGCCLLSTGLISYEIRFGNYVLLGMLPVYAAKINATVIGVTAVVYITVYLFLGLKTWWQSNRTMV